MNNKEFLKELAIRMDSTPQEVQQLVQQFVLVLADSLEEGDSLPIQAFGNFEVKKKLERIVVHPVTKQRQLIPPKLSIAFKASQTLKAKIK